MVPVTRSTVAAPVSDVRAFKLCRERKHRRCPGEVAPVVSAAEPRDRYLYPLRCSCACHGQRPPLRARSFLRP